MEKVVLNWSSGKDASMALLKLLNDPEKSVERLMTTVNRSNDRINMHGLHISLLKAQAVSLNIPLDILYLPKNMDMETYAERMTTQLKEYQNQGINTSAFGDIFLEDLRDYREKQLDTIGMKALFPLWNRSTDELMHEFIKNDFKAIVVSVNTHQLDASFCGREVDQDFLNELPEDVDPCGENGEFHTFCYDGPVFNNPVEFKKSEKVFKFYPAPRGNREGLDEYQFCFQDIKTTL